MLAVENNHFKTTYSKVFGETHPELFSLFTREGEMRTFARGRSLFTEGEDADGFYWIMKGYAKVCICLGLPDEQILTILGKGDFAGLTSCLNHTQYKKGCYALSGPVTAVYVSRDVFFEWFKTHPSLALPLLKQIESKIDRIENRATYFMRKTIDQRLAHALVLLGKKFGYSADNFLNVRMSPQELASFIGTTRTTIYRILKRFETGKLISVDQKRIAVLDKDALLAIS